KSRFHLRTTEELTSNSRASPESVISPRRTRSICSFLKAVVNSRRPSAPLRNSPILLLLEEVQHNLSQVSTPIGGRRTSFKVLMKRSQIPLHSGSPTYEGELRIPSQRSSPWNGSAVYWGPQSWRRLSPIATFER